MQKDIHDYIFLSQACPMCRMHVSAHKGKVQAIITLDLNSNHKYSNRKVIKIATDPTNSLPVHVTW